MGVEMRIVDPNTSNKDLTSSKLEKERKNQVCEKLSGFLMDKPMDKTFMHAYPLWWYLNKDTPCICRLKLLFEKIGHYLFEIINQDLINHPIFLSKAYLGNSFFYVERLGTF